MSNDIHVLSLEIEQLARERDDFLHITALRGQNGWEALIRKMEAEQTLKLDALLSMREPPDLYHTQGYIAALNTVMRIVVAAEEGAKNKNEEIVDRTRLKDDLLAQEEYQPQEIPPPAFA